MASVKVLKPTQPVNLLNTPVAPKPYTLSYYEYLEKNSIPYSFFVTNNAVGADYNQNIITIDDENFLFIKSITLEAGFRPSSGGATDGSVKLTVNGTQNVLCRLILGLVADGNTVAPLISNQNYSAPLRIVGPETINWFINSNLKGSVNIQGFIVPKIYVLF